MSKKLFEHHIHSVITDASIVISKKKTQFTTYRLFGEFIFNSIQAKNFNAIEQYLTPIVLELSEIMGLPPREAAMYVAKYFKEKKWEIYYDPINQIRNQFNIFLVS